MSLPIPSDLPLPTFMVLAPLASIAASLAAQSEPAARLIGLIGSSLSVVLALVVLFALYSTSGEARFDDRFGLLPFLDYHLAVDGLGILFVVATALLGFLLVLYGRLRERRVPGRYLALVFAFQAILTALFMAADLLLFWLLACAELIPAALLTRHWGTGRERRAATVLYLQFMSVGLALVLAGILILGWHHAALTGSWTFKLDVLLATPLPENLATLAFVLILVGTFVRMGQFPFHGWLPELCQHGTVATVGVFLVGTKLGIYALLRFLLPLLPEAAHAHKLLAVGLGIGGIFYGAILALMQLNLRRLLAFAAVSHTGMLVVGAFCLNREGLAGTLLLSVNFGVAASGMLLMAGLLQRRAGSTLLPRLGGLFDMMPLVGATYLISALSTMAMPGTPGFDAAHLLLQGAIETHDWAVTIAVATGNVLSAAFLLWAFQRIFLTHRRETALRPVRTRPTPSEILVTGILSLTLLGVGFYTEPWLEVINPSVARLAARLGAGSKHP